MTATACTESTCIFCQVSALNFVDLAGSERSTLAAKDDGDNKLRQTEGSAINKSLLTLGNVIRGLGDGRVSGTNPPPLGVCESALCPKVA